MNYAWIPNAISLSRIFFAVLIYICAVQGQWLAGGIFSAIAILGDSVDGWLAKRLKARSRVGVFLDPICDFCLTIGQVSGAFFAGAVGWKFLVLLFGLFVFTWVPVVTTNNGSMANKIALAANRTYFVAVVVGFVGLYFYMALGLTALWLLIPATPVAWWAIKTSVSHH